MARTLALLRGDVRSRLNEATAAFWSDAELTRWINEGASDVARRTESLRTRSTRRLATRRTRTRRPRTTVRADPRGDRYAGEAAGGEAPSPRRLTGVPAT